MALSDFTGEMRETPRGQCWTALQTLPQIRCLCGEELKELSLAAPAAGENNTQWMCICVCLCRCFRMQDSAALCVYMWVHMWDLLSGGFVWTRCVHILFARIPLHGYFHRNLKNVFFTYSSMYTVLLSSSRAPGYWIFWFVWLSASPTLWPRAFHLMCYSHVLMGSVCPKWCACLYTIRIKGL